MSTAFILTSKSMGNWIPKLSVSVKASFNRPLHCLLMRPMVSPPFDFSCRAKKVTILSQCMEYSSFSGKSSFSLNFYANMNVKSLKAPCKVLFLTKTHRVNPSSLTFDLHHLRFLKPEVSVFGRENDTNGAFTVYG